GNQRGAPDVLPEQPVRPDVQETGPRRGRGVEDGGGHARVRRFIHGGRQRRGRKRRSLGRRLHLLFRLFPFPPQAFHALELHHMVVRQPRRAGQVLVAVGLVVRQPLVFPQQVV